jgi:hypothetical protein
MPCPEVLEERAIGPGRQLRRAGGEGWDSVRGAPLKQAIQRYVPDPLAELMLLGGTLYRAYFCYRERPYLQDEFVMV